jgi:hypothetical protein
MLDNREKLAREAVRKIVKNLPWLDSKEESRRFYRAKMEAGSIERLVAAAREGDKDAVEILRDHARAIAGTDEIAPKCFHEFVWEWFIDGPPKARPGSGPKDTGLKNLTIRRLVKMISRDYSFPERTAYERRNDPDAPMTACRLVGEELRLDERTVEDILDDRARQS